LLDIGDERFGMAKDAGSAGVANFRVKVSPPAHLRSSFAAISGIRIW
jgi:hypothetical protein